MPLINVTPHTVGPRARDGGLIGEALASLPTSKTASSPQIVPEADVLKMAKDMGMDLRRVAGNVFENPAKRDFWAVREGKLVRLTGSTTEVADDERMDPANIDDPESTLRSILADLEF